MPHPDTGELMPITRNYLTTHAGSICTLSTVKSPEDRERVQIFGFVLAGESRLSLDTLVATFRDLTALVGDGLSPSLVGTMDGYALSWGNIAKKKRRESHRSPNARTAFG